MKLRKLMVLLLACLLVCTCAQAQEGPINRTVAASTANSLANLPMAARERTDSIVFGVTDLLGWTNPFYVETSGDEMMASLMYDELLFVNSQGKMGSGAAILTGNETGRTYTFTVQEGLTYADGTAVTARDFVNAFYLVLMPGFDGVYDISGAGIMGVEAYLSGEAQTVSGIEIRDDRTFTVSFERAGEAGLAYLALPALRMEVCGDMRRPDDMTAEEAARTFYPDTLLRVSRMSGEELAYGQYFLTELTVGEGAVLQKNSAYWRGEPNIGTVELKVVPIGEELDAMLSGKVDIISMMGSVEAVDRVCSVPSGFVNLYTWSGDVVGYLQMDLNSPLFEQDEVRQALACGFDRETARNDTVERYGKLPGMFLFDSFDAEADFLGEQYPYDPEKAAGLLTSAGWIKGDDGILQKDGIRFSFSLLYNTPNPIMDRIVSTMQKQYLDLGIEMIPESVTFENLMEYLDEENYEMIFMARRLNTSPAVTADLFAGSSILNSTGYTSEALDRLFSWAHRESDAVRQNVIYEGIYQQIYLDLPIIPLYRRNELLMVSARILNAQITTTHSITSDVYRFILTDSLASNW